MSDQELTKKDASSVTTPKAKKLKLPSISQRVLEHQKKTAEADADADILPNRIALVLDCSGSMSGRNILLLRQAVDAFCESTNFVDTSIALRPFPQGTCRPLSANKLAIMTSASTLEADGGTPMAQALRETIEEVQLMRAVLVSDGFAHDNSVDVARELYALAGIPIDCVHIGEAGGAEVLREIAEVTGGLYMKFKDVVTFSQAFSYLTPAKRGLIADRSADEIKLLTGADDAS